MLGLVLARHIFPFICAWRLHPNTRNQAKGMLEVLRLAMWIQSLIRESVCDLPTFFPWHLARPKAERNMDRPNVKRMLKLKVAHKDSPKGSGRPSPTFSGPQLLLEFVSWWPWRRFGEGLTAAVGLRPSFSETSNTSSWFGSLCRARVLLMSLWMKLG